MLLLSWGSLSRTAVPYHAAPPVPMRRWTRLCSVFGRHASSTVDRAAARSRIFRAVSDCCFNRPRGSDTESGLNDADRERVPGVRGLVGEHDGHDAVVPDNPAAFREDSAHPLSRSRRRLAFLHWSLSAHCWFLNRDGTGDRLVRLVSQVVSEPFGVDIARGTLFSQT